MAHAHSNGKNNKPNASISAAGGDDTEGKPTTFHDFLGNKGQGQESSPAAVGGGRPPAEVSPSATSDLGSERNVSNHLEGIPFYGSRGDIPGPGSSNRFTGYKRSNSDSFMMSSRDKFPQGQADSQDSPLLTKLLRYSGGGERPRRPHDEEMSFGMHQMRASFVSQSSAGGRAEANSSSKWDNRAIPVNVGPGMQYPPRAGQVMPFGYQAQTNRFKDTTTGPSVISQTAADEGSRTGIKGSGILSASGAVTKRPPSGVLIRSSKPTSGVCISEPESSTTPSQRGMESVGRQMTIFYGGQAHVFDNVHPNKADVIMALAGSNGGSWSTTYTPNSSARPTGGEKRVLNEEDAGLAILKELHGRPSDKGDTHRGFTSGSFPGIVRTMERSGSIRASKICDGGEAEEE